MMYYFKPTRAVFFSLVVALSMSACSLREPDHFTEDKVRVQEEKIEHTLDASDLNEAALAGLAHGYNKNGDGPLHITLSYDPKSKVNSAMAASDRAAELARVLRKEGVADVSTAIIPVQGSGAHSKAIVSYMGYNALGPKDCDLMPGVENRAVNANASYKMGCSVDTIFARQIANPSDLLGQKNDARSDGRRAANIGELYSAGVGNEALEGETASE